MSISEKLRECGELTCFHIVCELELGINTGRFPRRWINSASFLSTEPMPLPSSGAERVYPEHIENIVTQISKLTLLEVADLNTALKQRLNIPDAAPMMAAMPMAIAAEASQEEEEPVIQETKTSFSVRLTGVSADKKIALVKYIKGCMEGFNLVQAKKFVESVPNIVKSNIGKDEAEKLIKEIEEAGGQAELD